MTNLHEKIKEEKSTASTEELWTLFRGKLQTAIKDHIPHKQARVKENKIWVSPALTRLVKKRDRIFKKMPKQGTEELKQENKQLRREVQRQLRRAYWNYLIKTFEENDSQQTRKSKRFWTYIKHQKSSNVGVAPPTPPPPPPTLTDQWPPSIWWKRTGRSTEPAVPAGFQRRQELHQRTVCCQVWYASQPIPSPR